MCSKLSLKSHFVIHLVYILFLTYFTFKLLVAAEPKQMIEQSSDIGIVNAFSGCIIHVINFPAHNLDYSILKVPLILLRFFAYGHGNLIYASEFPSYYEMRKLQNKRQFKKADTMLKKLPSPKDGLKFVRPTFTEYFRLSTKNLNCEANIYLNPPTEQENPHLYTKSFKWSSIIKDPFWVSYIKDYDIHKWKVEFLDSILFYSNMQLQRRLDMQPSHYNL